MPSTLVHLVNAKMQRVYSALQIDIMTGSYWQMFDVGFRLNENSDSWLALRALELKVRSSRPLPVSSVAD